MSYEISESEIIQSIGFDKYTEFAMDVYSEMTKTSLYANPDPIMIGSGYVELQDGRFLIYVASLKKANNRIGDFGFNSLLISENLDDMLDFINKCKSKLSADQISFPIPA